MRKEELKALKQINATPLMVKMAKENMLDEQKDYMDGWGNRVKKSTKYDVFLRCQTRGNILMIAVFFPDEIVKGKKEPLYEIYCNKEGFEFITRIRPDGQKEKWSTAYLFNIGRIYNETWISEYGYHKEKADKRVWQNPEGKKTIKSFLGTKKGGWIGLVEWQKKARSEQIRKTEERQQKPWDEDMALVPEVLHGFTRWAFHDATDENFIFYHYEKAGAEKGYCSYCEKEVPIIKPKHNKKGKCRCCGKKVIFKADSKIQTLSRGIYKAECIQRIKGGIVIRQFSIQTWWRDAAPDSPHTYMREEKRRIATDNGYTRQYEYILWKNKKMRWCPEDNDYYGRGYGEPAILYKRNLSGLKKSVLKNSAIGLWKKLPVSTARYLYAEKKDPVIEKLVRIGMFKLAAELIKERSDEDLTDNKETELAKILKIDKARLKRLKKMNGNIYALKWLQAEKRVDKMWQDEMISDFSGEYFEPLSCFGFLKPPIHLIKIWNYMKKQSEMQKESMARVKSTWEDYLNMAEKAKWNIDAEQIQKPKNLKEAHSSVILALQGESMKKQAGKLEKKWPKVNGILPNIQKFEYVGKEFQIVTPKEVLDIVVEGTALRHCVHTCDFYFDRIQKNESYLFFLRRNNAPDTPWYTLEVEPSGNIRQKRTTGDNQNKDFEEAVKFLKEWQKYFVGKLTPEEKKLGIIADKARKKEYRELRKNGNKIWNGKLAGKLLVDVLESDFMEAI